MFLNLRINASRLAKFMFIVMLIIILVIFSIGIYNVFFKTDTSNENDVFTLTDTIKTDKVFEITTANYTNILQAVTNDIDSYIGAQVHFTGYVYRLIDFETNEFVLARNMMINEDPAQSLVVGFMCAYDKASDFEDGTWVDVTGTIIKGDYYGDIAQIKVSNMFEIYSPEDEYVLPPDNTYIPTSNM